jgi:two-component system, OmpR family, sensor kinase
VRYDGPHPYYAYGRRWRRMGPMGRYVRSRLRRRLFVWFGWAILTMGLATGFTMMTIGNPWWRDYQNALGVVASETARNWGDAAQREAYLRDISQAVHVDFELRDPKGAVLSRTGPSCDHSHFVAPIERDGAQLGTLLVCNRHSAGGVWRMLLVVFVAAVVLWGASGRIARRIARPLDELTDVVKRIGAGDYTARTKAGCYEPDEIGVVSEAVNDMAAKIQKQVSDQHELLASVSHELRTPLARVRIISELGRDVGPTPKTWNDLDREVVEMDALVGELLASSRLTFEALALRDLDLKDTAARAVERAGLSSERLKLESQQPTLKADPTLLARALANLLENARKHAGGAESLVVRDEPGAVVFEVHDRGPGLPQGGEGELFEAFGKGSDTRGEGLGLGLALVKRIALAHKGSAFAKNREGGGATVGVRLPV